MMITQPVGGLANQLCIYAAAKGIAKCNDHDLYLDLSHYHEKSKRNFRFNELNIKYQVKSPWEILVKFKKFSFNTNKVTRYLTDRLNRKGFYGNKCITETSLNYDMSLYKNSEDIHLSGNFISYKYYKDILPELLVEFKPKTVGTNFLSLVKHIRGQNYASIHFRRGDYLEDKVSRDFHGLLGIEYYKKAVKWLVDHKGVKTFYIFTDNVELAKESFHFINDVNFVGENSNITDIEELELMKYYNNNIIANSGFSRWASLLNYNEEPSIIMPKQWFKAIESHIENF
jgi:hypothetical protein